MTMTFAFVQWSISSTLQAYQQRYPCPPRRSCCFQGEAGEIERVSTAEPLQHKDSLQWLLEVSCTKWLDFGLQWPRSALRLPVLAKLWEMQTLWGDGEEANWSPPHPEKKKPMKILQLNCQERRGLRREFPSTQTRAAEQLLALLAVQHPQQQPHGEAGQGASVFPCSSRLLCQYCICSRSCRDLVLPCGVTERLSPGCICLPCLLTQFLYQGNQVLSESKFLMTTR